MGGSAEFMGGMGKCSWWNSLRDLRVVRVRIIALLEGVRMEDLQ